MDLADIRTDYHRGRLRREGLREDPIEQFQIWLDEACAAGLTEPTAMSLATSSKDRGFVFFTNLESRKACHIQENPNVSLLFPWLLLERQVVVTGQAAKISTVESLKYFASRPYGSQLAAWTSHQSSVISSRQLLEMEWERLKQKFSGGKIPLPSFWGGYRVIPETIEFWQGGHHRLHDRFQYVQQRNGSWAINRLAP